MQLSDCKHHHQKLRPDLIWSNASKNLSNLTLGKIAGTQKVGFRFCTPLPAQYMGEEIPGREYSRHFYNQFHCHHFSHLCRQQLCQTSSLFNQIGDKKKWNSACYSEWNGKVRGMSNGGSRAPLSKPINPYFTVTTPPIKQLAETFRPCLLQVPQKFRNLRTPYIFPQHNTLHLFVAMVTQSYCTMAGDKDFIIILKR